MSDTMNNENTEMKYLGVEATERLIENLSANMQNSLLDKLSYNEQTLTPEQQEQVRKNIGVVQPDYAQNDPTAPDYIKNRLAYTEPRVLTYDGALDKRGESNSNGIYSVRVSDELIDLNSVKKVELTPANGDPMTFEVNSENSYIEIKDGYPCMFGILNGLTAPVIYVITSDVDFGDLGYIKAGTYFYGYENQNMVGYISCVEYGEEIVHKVDPKYLPANGFGYTEQADNVILESTLEFISESEGNPGMASSEYIDLKAGEKYIVIFDGVEYECEGFAFAQPGTNLVCVGNAGLAFGDTESMTDDPFIIAAVSSAEYAGCEFMLIDPSTFEPIIGEHTFKIIHKANVVHKIDPMFFDQLGWKQEKYVPVVNMPMHFGEGQFSDIYPAPFLEEGETYRVTYSGHTYELQAKSASINGMSGIYIGDFGFVDFTPTTYPFVIGQYHEDVESWYMIVCAVDPDAFPNEIIPLEDMHQVKVEHKKKIVQKIDPDLYERLAWEDKIVKEIIPETVIPGVYEQEVPFGITANTEYVVMFDGTEYRVTGRSLDASMDGTDIHIEFIGNPALFEIGEDSDLPFLVMDASVYGMTMAGISCLDDTVDHTISVTGTVVDIHKIDEKFLPESPLSKTFTTVDIIAANSGTSSDAISYDGYVTEECVVHIVIDGTVYDLPVLGCYNYTGGVANSSIFDGFSSIIFAGDTDLANTMATNMFGAAISNCKIVSSPYMCYLQTCVRKGKRSTEFYGYAISNGSTTVTADGVFVDLVNYPPIDVRHFTEINIPWDLAKQPPSTTRDDINNAFHNLRAGLTVRGTLNGSPVEIIAIEFSGTTYTYLTVRNLKGVYYRVTIDRLSRSTVEQISQSGSGDFTLPSTVPNITSATENQMVVVEAVDESGKPTSWKAVDAPEGVDVSGLIDSHNTDVDAHSDIREAIENKPGWKGTGIGAETFNTIYNIALGTHSHAEGYYTIASGINSHAEGYGLIKNITVSGDANSLTYTISETYEIDYTGFFIKYNNIYAKITSHDIGAHTITVEATLSGSSLSNMPAVLCSAANGHHSHTEGCFAIANGEASHAEGNRTRANGTYSHAEGSLNTANGFGSHAEGCFTVANGERSHAEGSSTYANGDNSHAEGCATTAIGDCSHVQGKFNIPDNNSVYAHIVGNGDNAGDLSNAHTVDWHGNAWYAGDVYVGSTSGTNRDEGSKKLASEGYVQEAVSDKIATMAIPATSDMTEKVGINAEGQLVTKPIGGGIVDHILMRDAENGFTYIIEMRGGNLVSSAMPSGIRIAKSPDKVDYVEGDLVDVTGMVVEAVYEDDTSNIVEDYTYAELAHADGMLVISWTSRGVTYTASMNLNVTPMAGILVDFEYTDNGDGTYTLTDWKGTLNGEASTEIVIPDHKNIQL